MDYSDVQHYMYMVLVTHATTTIDECLHAGRWGTLFLETVLWSL